MPLRNVLLSTEIGIRYPDNIGETCFLVASDSSLFLPTTQRSNATQKRR